MAPDSAAPCPRPTEHQRTQPYVIRASQRGQTLRRPVIESPPDPLMPRRYPDRVEVKLDYAIDTNRPRTHYRIESYFFVPRSLGLDMHTYSRDEFYTDMHAYIRFKEPDIPAAELADLDAPSSPLHRAQALLDAARGHLDTLSREQLGYELRVFGCIVRTNLRDVALDVHAKLDRIEGPSPHSVLIDDVSQGLARLLDDVDLMCGALRGMRATFFQPRRPPWLSELFEFVDEYIGIVAESCLTSVLIHIDEHEGLGPTKHELRATLIARIEAEQRHREAAGYEQSVLTAERENRSHVYRKSALKKFMSSVLFLNISKQEEGGGIANITAGLAAAVAMSFSTVAAMWSQGQYGLNSFPFIIALIIGYVFKDRIKEWLRTYFRRLASKRLYDYSVHIYDPNTDTVIGRCRESFEFVPHSKVPEDILHYRHNDSKSVLEPETKPEVVMKYIKDVTLRGKRIAKLGRQVNDISDINRFNISRFLLRMNEPEEVVATYDAARDKVVGVSCPKTYHVNMVVVRTADEQAMKVDRYRLVLDKRGVKALHFVETDRSDSYVHEHAVMDSRSDMARSGG